LTENKTIQRELRRRPTPRTIPSGKMTPQANIWMKIWIHSVVSCKPSGQFPELSSCAFFSGRDRCRPSGTYNRVLGDRLSLLDVVFAVLVSQDCG
jgi:hypothetical protein